MKTIKEFLEEYKKDYVLEEIFIKSESGNIIYWGNIEDFYREGIKKSRLEMESWKVIKSIMWDLGKKLLVETKI